MLIISLMIILCSFLSLYCLGHQENNIIVFVLELCLALSSHWVLISSSFKAMRIDILSALACTFLGHYCTSNATSIKESLFPIFGGVPMLFFGFYSFKMEQNYNGASLYF